MNCELCSTTGETLLWRGQHSRVILVADEAYPGFCRVIWNEHIKEMTDLPAPMRNELMNTVFVVENAVRVVMQPEKINLASLGNMAPHLHWHVIPRFVDDKHFPNPIWGEALRTPQHRHATDIEARLRASILERFPV
jgi:diadenosine tetraphosphate (Ap4A) HIT family hydrolase